MGIRAISTAATHLGIVGSSSGTACWFASMDTGNALVYYAVAAFAALIGCFVVAVAWAGVPPESIEPPAVRTLGIGIEEYSAEQMEAGDI